MHGPALALVLIVLLGGAAQAQRIDRAHSRSQRPTSPGSVDARAGTDAGVIFTNGTYVTQAGVGAGGADVSELQSPSIVFGYNANQVLDARLADDFTVPANATWDATTLVWNG